MGFDATRHALFAATLLLALAGCGKKDEAKPAAPEGDGPQIATSIEDYALPVDKSDQVTAIDAATGETGGMPRDGGAVIRTEKPEERPAVEPPADGNSAAPAAPAAPTPLVVPPPPTAQPVAPPATGQ